MNPAVERDLPLLRSAGLAGFFRSRELRQAGLARSRLLALLRAGAVERVWRGLYRLADAEVTENHSLAAVCARIPNAIVCLLSALRVHEIGTQSPPAVWIAIPHKARLPRVPEIRLRIVRFSGAAQTFGVEETWFEGVRVRITSPARTIVDCFRLERLVGPEIPMEALLDALRQRKVTVAELDRMLRVFPSRRLAAALDVLLI